MPGSGYPWQGFAQFHERIMPEFVLILLFFLALIAFFAMYGFFSFLRKLFGDYAKQRSEDTAPSLKDEVTSALAVLQRLYRRNRINAEQYHQFLDGLNQEFGDQIELHPAWWQPESPPQPAPFQQPGQITEEATPNNIDAGGISPVSDAGLISEVVDAEIKIGEMTEPAVSPVLPEMAAASTSMDQPTKTPQIPPQELPAGPRELPPSAPMRPRRKLSDVLAAFMQEKNIRWGELASGILIVGSAIGLVVSLRNELTDTIPYFPALLFMLITAAIHAAGIYTLRKWNLKNTSRGTLLIGLLLVPLNFLAACVLTGSEQLRRPLDDPSYWAAVLTGVGFFGLMTWWSSRFLLRRGYGGLTIGIMITAILTLIINRLEIPVTSSWTVLSLAAALAACAVVGSGAWTLAVRTRALSSRTVNRLFIRLGLSLFAMATAASLILIRTADPHHTLVAMTPAITAVLMLSVAAGKAIYSRVCGADRNAQMIAGQSLMILGLLLSAVSIVVSAANPTMLLLNGIVAALSLWMIAERQNIPAVLPAAWASLALSVLTGVSMVAGRIGVDSWTPLPDFLLALVNGQSGISLVALSAGIVGLGFATRFVAFGTNNDLANEKTRMNQISALAIAGFGCLIALAAGLLNQQSVFDTMTASVLLVLGAFTLFTFALRSKIRGLPTAASLTLLAGLAFSLLWNPTTSAWIVPLCFGLNANWLWVFVGQAWVVGLAAALSSRAIPVNDLSSITREFGAMAAIAAGIATVGSLIYANSDAGLTTLTVALMLGAWSSIAWSHRHAGAKAINYSMCLALTSGLLPSVIVYQYAANLGLPLARELSHWFVQFIVLSIWSTCWTISAVLLGRSKSIAWIFKNQQLRADQLGLGLIVVAIAWLVGLRLYEAIGRELSVSFISTVSPITEILFVAWLAIAASAAALIAGLFERPNLLKSGALLGLFILACALLAAPFNASNSVGSAIRWLLPFGALAASSLSFFDNAFQRRWNVARQFVGLDTGHTETERTQRIPVRDSNGKQYLVNALLSVSAIIVLAISSIVTIQVLLTEAGVASLGGPSSVSWFGNMRAELNYGVPGVVLTTAILMFAISQRRSVLALAGSAVYQYVVLFSLVMLFLSVHPALATQRFIETLQAVSLGMTGYGFIWYWQRRRIGDSARISLSRQLTINQIELHTLINCILVTSLAVLIAGRFFTFPQLAGGWVNTAGGPLGIVALFAVVGLAYLVWCERLTAEKTPELANGLCCWAGLVLTAMVAAIVDRISGGGQWLGFRIIMWGSVVVAGGLVGMAAIRLRKGNASVSPFPALLAAIVAMLFATRGAWSDPTGYLPYLSAMLLAVVLTTLIGFITRDAWPSLVAAISVIVGAHTIATVDPRGMFNAGLFDSINLAVLGLTVLSVSWTGFCVWRYRHKEITSKTFSALPNVVLLGSSIWLLTGSLLEWAVQSEPAMFGGIPVLAYPWGVAAVVSTLLLSLLHTWNDKNRFQVASCCLGSVGVTVLVVAVSADELIARNVLIMFFVSLVVAVWGIGWRYRNRCFELAEKSRVPRLGILQHALQRQLPNYTIIVASVLLVAAFVSIQTVEKPSLRFLTAVTPIALAIGIGCQSDPKERRWFQHVSLVLLTLGLVFAARTDLRPSVTLQASLQFAIRNLLVLAGAVLVYGVLITKKVQIGKAWLSTLGEMTIATGIAAGLCLAGVVMLEFNLFVDGVGCGVSIPEAIATMVVIIGITAGLIFVAVRPKNDLFALSLPGRMGYVYAAQAVVVLLICHVYFSMPWLFQFGIKQYWPYIAMALSFAGVGLARVLEKRNLTVLGTPLFQTAAVLPVLVSVLFRGIDSEADVSVVLLMAGFSYLLISYLHRSILSGAAAIVFGNLALWGFYDRFSGFSFVEHPQLWLIPPAVSVLIAGHLAAHMLSARQLATLRYICVTVIYVSSTSEIFITGLGTQLWPPMILATFAILGILLGIMMQIRSYLFLGSLFLLMAMITMVSHAHLSLHHVWPWWAFGIGMGVAILVMFGLFESRKNKLRALAGRLQKWDL